MVKLFDTALVGKDAQSALDFISNLLQSSVDYSIIGKDLNDKILLWNEGAKRLFGYEPDEVIGKMNAATLRTPEDREANKPKEMMDTALKTGRWEGMVEAVKKNGERFPTETVETPYLDSAGKPIGFLIISRDISKELHLIDQFRETEFYTRSLIESSIDPLMTTDPFGNITDVNQQMEEITGYKRNELIGTPFKNYVTDPARAEEGIRRVLLEKKLINYELIVRARNGETTLVSYNATIFMDRKGKLQGVFAAARDISEYKKLEWQLHNEQNYTRSLIEATIDALSTIDSDGIITDVNQQMIFLTESSRNELIGTPFKRYFTDAKRAEEGVQLVLKEGHVRNYALMAIGKKGKETPVSYNAVTYYDQDGKLKGVFASARDITEQKIAEEKLKEAIENLARSNKDLEQFAYIASHDLQQPLRMVESYTQLLVRRYKDKLDQDANDFIGFVVDGVKRMQGLINNLLDYSRVTTRGKPLLPTDCNQILQQVLTDFQEKITERKAEITYDKLPVINADEIQIAQLFQNLISNAIKFCEKNPKVHIGIKDEKDEWIFSVSDNGIGIAAEHFDHVFVIFQRLVTEEQYPGNGMGLAICKRIVERHGGKIWLESTVGKGSTFYFSIPK